MSAGKTFIARIETGATAMHIVEDPHPGHVSNFRGVSAQPGIRFWTGPCERNRQVRAAWVPTGIYFGTPPEPDRPIHVLTSRTRL